MSNGDVLKASAEVGGRELSIQTGELAKQAGGSVLVQYGETVILGTANMSNPWNDDADFMPLLVDYEEKFYAAGKIKGSRFVKREGRPSEEATLTARLTDRAIRPLFPEGMINDLQVVLTVLSYDGENDPDILAINAASAALSISDAPWGAESGPIAAVKVGRVDGEFVINPTQEQKEKSDLDLMVAGTKDQVAMIEAGANEVPEDAMIDALEAAQAAIATIVPVIEEVQSKAGKEKTEAKIVKNDEEQEKKVADLAREPLFAALKTAKTKQDFRNAEKAAREAVEAGLSEEDKEAISDKLVKHVVHELRGQHARDEAFASNWREMGRGFDELRDINTKVGLLPRTHGTGLFQRGETQILTVATLGGPGDVQWLDTMEIEEKRHYIHHYNFPAYSVGENKPSRGPGRREIGHGALAERALLPVLPDREEWPYTMMVVSEVLESNGSSSMASACGSSLALMDAGVPLKKPVAGIAMGLFTNDDGDYRVLTDIAGVEDEKGDMDFKVAGTADGITALQMDIKVTGLTREILEKALEQAKQARLQILDNMNATLPAGRPELNKYAPRIETIKIDPEKIGDVIGPKGKHINDIIEQTGVEIDIDDDGLVAITSNDGEGMKKAVEWVKNMTREVVVGEQFQGKVVKLMNFGAFVELTPGTEGMVHISKFRSERVDDIHDVAKVGDIIPVVVEEIDNMGRINLKHQDYTGGGEEPRERKPRPSTNKGPFAGPRPPR